MSTERWFAMGGGGGGSEKPPLPGVDLPEEVPAAEIMRAPRFEIGQLVRAPNLIIDETGEKLESGWRVGHIEEHDEDTGERVYVIVKPAPANNSIIQSVTESQLIEWNS